MRIGTGYDVHRLAEGLPLWIGGEKIPHSHGLVGHSDADVLLHAICDALLGAAALGDIGKHFPDTDERYKGISSLKLLAEVGRLLREKGYNPLAYRLFCLQSHYRKVLLFSWENLDNAQTAYDKLVSRIAALQAEPENPADAEAAAALRQSFRDAMDNDLNTSLAVTALYDVLKARVSDGTKRALIGDFDTVLSLGLLEAAEEKQTAAPQEGDAEIDALVEARTAAKKAKNFAEADRIRDQRKEMGVVLVDSREGTTWHR